MAIFEKKIQVVCITGYTVHLWMVNLAYFDLIGYLSHFDIDERLLRLWCEAPMCSDHAHLCRLAQVNSNTLIVFIAPNRLCDWDVITSQCTSACSFPYCSHASDYPSSCHCWHACRRLPTPALGPWFPNEIQNLLSSEKRTLDHWATVQFFSLAQVRHLWWQL